MAHLRARQSTSWPATKPLFCGKFPNCSVYTSCACGSTHRMPLVPALALPCCTLLRWDALRVPLASWPADTNQAETKHG